MDSAVSVPASIATKRKAPDDTELPLTKRLPFTVASLIPNLIDLTGEEDARSYRVATKVRAPILREPFVPRAEAFTNSARKSEPPPKHMPVLEKQNVELKAQLRPQKNVTANEKRSMQSKNARMEEALKRKDDGLEPVNEALRAQVADPKAQTGMPDDGSRAHRETLTRRISQLGWERQALVINVAQLEVKIGLLEEEVTGLSQDIGERVKLYNEAVNEHSTVVTERNAEVDSIMRENKKLKKTIKSNERHAKASKEEHDALLKQLKEREELISRYGNDKEDETERIEELFAQKRNLEKELRKRGEDIIQLRRDAGSQIKLTNAQKAAEEGKRLLLTRIGGVFAHYRSLHEKNAVLVAKLTAMARAGGFGNHGSIYRKELANLTGVSLEDLPEYKATL